MADIHQTQSLSIQQKVDHIIQKDPHLSPYRQILAQRLIAIEERQRALTHTCGSLAAYASAHHYFGLHRESDCWIFREWAPYAKAVYLIGEHSRWKKSSSYQLRRISDDGTWELRLPITTLKHLSLYRIVVQWPGGQGDRIPAFARTASRSPLGHAVSGCKSRPSA